MTAEYGTEQDIVTLYHNGVPEMIGRKTVEKLFQGEFIVRFLYPSW